MISAPTFAATSDQMICCSQRSLIGLPLTGMRLGGTSSWVAAAMVCPPVRADAAWPAAGQPR